MDKAKENYKVGEVRIVSADQIKIEYARSVSYEEKKFFCSNCGEYVTYVNKDKGKTFFRHIKKTEETKECELRIDAQSQLSVYQKVGLPTYLKKDSNGNFNLFIGFYAIDKKIMELSKNEKASITILGGKSNYNLTKKYFIDNINFSSDILTLKQINFLATKYKMEYSTLNAKSLLSDKWGDEIEGINANGALFKFGENGGRKIRINEEITTNTDYFCICKDNSKFISFSGINYLEVGSISFVNGVYKVYKISFSLSGWDNERLSEFCREIFKISLVNKPYEIIPIWPPTINCDNKIELVFNKNNLLLLKSLQQNTRAFIHRMKYYSEINLNKVSDNQYLFKISPSYMERAININDEYNSKYLLVSNYKGNFKSFSNNIILTDVNENVIERGKYDKLPLQGKLKIYSNSEIDIIHYRRGIIYKLYRVKSKENLINDLKYGDKLIAKIGLKKNTIIEFEKVKEEITELFLNDVEIYKKLKKLNEPFEPVDTYTRAIFRYLKNYPKTFNLIKSYIIKNKMPIAAKKILKKIEIK
ncbi:Uncharacterised protein [[Clostridium] sordellii]|uniref:hypothetical protein n=1 Tax=Paraclostridium sordellii TaxID=1505 RepID=UPI0005E93B95|nr:hypothetical protein [Paeniclostridium sordellii]CEP95570.1 Uncharacterised protein [[Clostridium] sordellii] [Paeniclostridium sordellii]